MPELAEVEYYRKQWNPGLGKLVREVRLHPKARIFRGQDTKSLIECLTESRLISSESRGKQMLFRFARGTLGVHLGMTGELRVEAADFAPGKHDHLVLIQARRSLVFTDPRLFGRILFEPGKVDPAWWLALPPDCMSPDFTAERVVLFLQRRRGAPLKAVLLMQECFPGVGNWMADEILWRQRLHPATRAGRLSSKSVEQLHEAVVALCREALAIIGTDWSDPPDSWLFNHRWKPGGYCPRCGLELERAAVGGRTTCWCGRCQSESKR